MNGLNLNWGPALFNDWTSVMSPLYDEYDDDRYENSRPLRHRQQQPQPAYARKGVIKQEPHPHRGVRGMDCEEIKNEKHALAREDVSGHKSCDVSTLVPEQKEKALSEKDASEIIAAFVVGSVVRRTRVLDKLREIKSIRERVQKLESSYNLKSRNLSDRDALIVSESLMKELLHLDAIDARFVRNQRKAVVRYVDSVLKKVDDIMASKDETQSDEQVPQQPIPDAYGSDGGANATMDYRSPRDSRIQDKAVPAKSSWNNEDKPLPAPAQLFRAETEAKEQTQEGPMLGSATGTTRSIAKKESQAQLDGGLTRSPSSCRAHYMTQERVKNGRCDSKFPSPDTRNSRLPASELVQQLRRAELVRQQREALQAVELQQELLAHQVRQRLAPWTQHPLYLTGRRAFYI